MSKELPKALFAKDRSSFALIDPSTELYYRKLDRHGWLNNSFRQHVAISYVWSEWKRDPSDSLPDWSLIRKRLLYILGPNASSAIRLETGNATCCWLDSKCIDQDSVTSKSHWIPRMDQIYAEAKCTLLLLRDPALLVLVPVAQGMRCNIKSKTTILDWPHICLLSQSCTILSALSFDQENACVQALRRLYDGNWRKRAWIFQEILLSKKYLLTLQDGDYIELGDIGVIANLLFQRHPNETWLGHFSDWCRRLFYLRHFYIDSAFHHLSEANVLQMATGLDASVPADKIYALCGILRLKNISYDSKHSADEALQVVVGELVKRGRLAWLYAIPPPMDDQGIQLCEDSITPFVLTRLRDALVENRNKMHFSKASVGFPVLCIGKITQIKLLAEVLREASDWIKEHQSVDFPPELQYLFFIPKIIRRIALDVVNPLLTEPLFSQICQGLGITPESESRPTRVWRMIMELYTKDLTSAPSSIGGIEDQEDLPSVILVDSAARSLHGRLRMVQDEFNVIWWCSYDDSSSITLSLGPRTCTPGNHICSVKDDDQLLLAASFLTPDNNPISEATDAHFKGMIYSLDTVMTIQWRVKLPVGHVVFAPLDMQEPLLGDHPFNDRFKDRRFDEYIKTGASRSATILSLFGRSWNQKRRLMFLNLLCKP